MVKHADAGLQVDGASFKATVHTEESLVETAQLCQRPDLNIPEG